MAGRAWVLLLNILEKSISSWEKKRVKSMPDTGGKSYKRKVGLIPWERSRVECLAKSKEYSGDDKLLTVNV